MGGKVEVDVVAFNATADVFDAPPSVVGNIHNGAEGVVAGVGRDGAPTGFCAGGGDADGLGLAFVGTGGVDGLEFPITLPAAAFAAVAVAGGLHLNDFWLLVAWNLVFIAPS